MKKAVLVSNGPGELYTWVRPIIQALKSYPVELTIMLIPCQFASGKEAEIAQSFGVEHVISVKESLVLMAGGRLPQHLSAQTAFVLSLGGNVSYATRLANRLKAPCFAYSFIPFHYPALQTHFLSDEGAKQATQNLGMDKDKLEVVGNLVADAVENAPPVETAGNPHLLLFMGSRPAMTMYLLPFVIAVVDKIAQQLPQARFVWPVSRFVSAKQVAQGVAGKYRLSHEDTAGTLEEQHILTPGGFHIELVEEAERYRHMQTADLALTIPGTNTLELGIATVPSVVIFPFQKPALVPLTGWAHWFGYLPFIGNTIRKKALKHFEKNLVALPNILTQEQIVPELKGMITPSQVADHCIGLLSDVNQRHLIRQRLSETMPQAGAAQRLVQSLLEKIDL